MIEHLITQAYADRHVRVITVYAQNPDGSTPDDINCNHWRNAYHLTSFMTRDPMGATQRYVPGNAFPSNVVIDQHGNIYDVLYGSESGLTTLTNDLDAISRRRVCKSLRRPSHPPPRASVHDTTPLRPRQNFPERLHRGPRLFARRARRGGRSVRARDCLQSPGSGRRRTRSRTRRWRRTARTTSIRISTTTTSSRSPNASTRRSRLRHGGFSSASMLRADV